MSLLSLQLALAHADTSGAGSSSGSADLSSVTSGAQKIFYDNAVKDAQKSKLADEISIGVWGATAALCGYNCFSYLTALKAARTKVATAAQLVDGIETTYDAPCNHAMAATQPVNQRAIAQLQADQIKAESDEATAAALQGAPTGATAAAALPVKATPVGPDESLALSATQIITNAETVFVNYQSTAVTAHANPYTQPLAALCDKGSSDLAPAIQSLQTSTAAMNQVVAHVTTIGTVCAGMGIAGAGADVLMAATMQKDITEGLPSVLGAAPGAIALASYAGKAVNPVKQANTMGVTSCFSAGFAVVLGAWKAYSLVQADKASKANQQSSDSLNSTSRNDAGFSRKAMVAALRWGGYFLRSFESCAVASTEDVARGVCDVSSLTGPESHLACALSEDASLKRIYDTNPSNLDALFAQTESTFGIGREQFLTTKPPTMDKIAMLMTKDAPTLAPQVTDYFRQAQLRVDSSGASWHPVLARAENPPAAAGPMVDAPAVLTPSAISSPTAAAMPEGARAPASGSDKIDDGAIADTKANLFTIISARYQQDADARIGKTEWADPYNRFVAGLPSLSH